MVAFQHKFSRLILALTPILTPFTAWLYRSKFSRTIAIRLFLITSLAPIFGYIRRPLVLREYKEQLQQQNKSKEAEMKQSLQESKLDFTSADNNFEYMILVKSEKKYEDEELFEKQKTLFELNNEILSKSSENENYFDGIKFLFLGEQPIYEGLKENLPNEQANNFDFVQKQAKKGGMMPPKEDSILLIAKQPNGDNRILMEWAFERDVTLKTIIRQISKHKHRKFVQSMNF